jgi:hypothetical protein
MRQTWLRAAYLPDFDPRDCVVVLAICANGRTVAENLLSKWRFPLIDSAIIRMRQQDEHPVWPNTK